MSGLTTSFSAISAFDPLVGSIVGVEEGGKGTPGVLGTVSGTQGAITVAIYIVLAAVVSVVVVRRRDVA